MKDELDSECDNIRTDIPGARMDREDTLSDESDLQDSTSSLRDELISIEDVTDVIIECHNISDLLDSGSLSTSTSRLRDSLLIEEDNSIIKSGVIAVGTIPFTLETAIFVSVKESRQNIVLLKVIY